MIVSVCQHISLIFQEPSSLIDSTLQYGGQVLTRFSLHKHPGFNIIKVTSDLMLIKVTSDLIPIKVTSDLIHIKVTSDLMMELLKAGTQPNSNNFMKKLPPPRIEPEPVDQELSTIPLDQRNACFNLEKMSYLFNQLKYQP